MRSDVKVARELVVDMQSIQMLNRISAPAILVSPNLVISGHNDAFSKVFPNTLTWEKSVSLLDVVHESARSRVQYSLLNQDDSDSGNIQTLRFPMRDSQYDISLTPLLWEFERGVGYLATLKERSSSYLNNGFLNRTLEHWQSVVSYDSDSYWEIDITENITVLSDGWYHTRGLCPKDDSRSSPSKWLSFVHNDDIERIKSTIAEVISGRLSSFELQYREQHARGSWIWLHSYAHVSEWSEDGKPLNLIGSEQDITKLKDDESKLKKLNHLEERWKVVIESTEQGLWDYDYETSSFYRSNNWYEIRGLKPDYQLKPNVNNLLSRAHPDDKALILEQRDRIVSGDIDTIEYEYRERHDDGHWIWILRRGRIVHRDSKGRPMRVIGTDSNVTDLIAQGRKYVSLSKSLELAVTAAEIGVWEFDLQSQTEHWDQQMKGIYGFDVNYTVSDDLQWASHLHPEDQEGVLNEFARCLDTSEDFNKDYRIIKADGRVGHIRSRATAFKDAQGNGKLIGVNWDITKDRELAQNLEHANLIAHRQNKALEAARSKMEYDALHDSLTGLANRRKLDEYQRDAQQKAGRDGYCPVVLHIDLDRFKQINDTLGHAAGDIVLVHVANILRNNAPDDAIVARVGGDEFVMFIDAELSKDKLVNIAQSMINEAQEPLIIHDKKCRFGISVGIAVGSLDGEKGTRLFANADLALYLAKNEGRGRYAFYTEELKTEHAAKQRLSEELLTALDNKEFFCLYQPQFNAATLDLSGVEALVRWRRANGEIWAPDRFLSAAEELGIVAQIDHLVLEMALNDMKKWDEAELAIPRMSVNVSAKRLMDPDLPEKLAFLKDAPGPFAFELLETVFLDTYDNQLGENLQYIRDMGIDIEIDDFGTGHASIIGLLKLKPSRLKIDRELIQPIAQSETQRLLVGSIIEIGRLQKISVVAEGVETPEHIERLRELKCDYLQGYGLAGPMPAEQLKALLNAAQFHGKYSPFGI